MKKVKVNDILLVIVITLLFVSVILMRAFNIYYSKNNADINFEVKAQK